jgi:predicted Zn-dependent peptidase
MLISKRFLGMFFIVWLAAAGAGGLWGQSFQDLESKVVKHTLANGLRFLIVERHDAPVASFVTYADVGAVNEVRGITGMAHFFEHMAFKGTGTVGTNDIEAELKAIAREDEIYERILEEQRRPGGPDPAELDRLEKELKEAVEYSKTLIVSNEFGETIKKEGGVGLNAGTSYDQTMYFYSLPSNKMELWFSLESDRFYDPVLREFFTERDVVMEERRLRTESQPIGKLLEEFLTLAYKAHPYGDPVVGHMSDLENMTREDAMKFFRTNYTPRNLVCAVVGDVKAAEVIALAEKYWGRIPAGPERKPVVTVEPPQLGERRVEVEDASQPFVFIGYHRPDIKHEDAAAFEAITDIIGQGRTSWLYKSLVKEKQLAVMTFAFANITSGKYPTLFIFVAVPAQGKAVEEVEAAMYEQIDRLKEELVSAEELEAVKTRAKVNFLSGLRSNIGLAEQLARYETIFDDYGRVFREVDEIEAITAEDIQRVAKTYFKKKNRTVAVIVPPEEAND